MRRIALTIFAVVAILISGASTAFATPGDPHQVWVCKYVGQPGDFETLKPGKNPIIVDVAAADAYVGADFADGQTHSFVIAIATDDNTGRGETYTGEAQCPSAPTVTPTPSTSPSIEPSESPTPSEQPSETPSVTPPAPSPSDSPSASPTPKPSETPSTSSSPTLKPSSKPTHEHPVATPPSTDTEPSSTAVADGKVNMLFLLSGLGTLAYLMIWKFKRPYHR